MRFRKIDRYLLLLAGLFVLAILRRTDLPGEEVLPDVYRAVVHQPLLAQASGALSEGEQEVVRLRSRLEAANHRIRQLEQQLSSRKELGRFLSKMSWRRPPVAIPAWVFSVDPDVYRRSFQIDKGAKAGIRTKMPVVVGKALLGRVVKTDRRTAVVRRVDDPVFRIEVEIPIGKDGKQGYVRGIAIGSGDRGLGVRFLRGVGGVTPGAAVFTSAHDKNIPAGLLVGWIDEVTDADRDSVLEVTVTPAASLGRLSQVEVLKIESGDR